MKKYDKEIVEQMRQYFGQLSEKDKRHYAALEVQKLGFGGKKYISEILNISRPRIDRGILDLTDKKRYEQIPVDKQRRIGGGRKKKKKNIQNY